MKPDVVDLLEQGKEPWMILREETRRQHTGEDGQEGGGEPWGRVAACVVRQRSYIPVLFVKPSPKAPRLVAHDLVTWGGNKNLNMSWKGNFNFTPFTSHLISVIFQTRFH